MYEVRVKHSSSKPILCFACNASEPLRLEHVHTALHLWQAAAMLGGKVALRMEDSKTKSGTAGFDEMIRDDLHWLGLEWAGPILRQSEQLGQYVAAGDHLRVQGLLYPCFCSDAEIAAASPRPAPDGSPLYAGTCKQLDRGAIITRLERGDAVRFRLDTAGAIAMAGMVTYSAVAPLITDRPQIRYARPEIWGDIALQAQGAPASRILRAVIDDAAQGITHVVLDRGLEAESDIRALLLTVLGLPSPIYAFHRGVPYPGADQPLAELRAAGWTPAEIRAAVGF